MGRTFTGVLRNSYLISPTGDIAKVYEKINPLIHSGQILRDLEALTTI